MSRGPKLCHVAVSSIEQLTPRTKRITLAGTDLETFSEPEPGAYVKLIFADIAPGEPVTKAILKPRSRTYTPRYFDRARGELAVDFVIHGEGLGSNWAQSAQRGDKLMVGGPGRGYSIPDDLRHLIVLVDETGMPAAGTVLDALPSVASARIVCEVREGEQRPPSDERDQACEWLFTSNESSTGDQLAGMVERLARAAPADAYWFVACEAGVMRTIRRQLLEHPGIGPAQLYTRGYWKAGLQNHTDGDFGKDVA